MLNKNIEKQKQRIIKELNDYGYRNTAKYVNDDKLFYHLYLLVYTSGRILGKRDNNKSKYLKRAVCSLLYGGETGDSFNNGRRRIKKIIDVALYFDSILEFRKARERVSNYVDKSLVTFVICELYYGLLNRNKWDGPECLTTASGVFVENTGNNKNFYDEDTDTYELQGDVGYFSANIPGQSEMLLNKELITAAKEYYGGEFIDALLKGYSIGEAITKQYGTTDEKEKNKFRMRINRGKEKINAALKRRFQL